MHRSNQLTRREWLTATACLGLFSHSTPSPAAEPFRIGEFRKVYQPGPRNASGNPPKGWHLNDHTFIRGDDGLWHLFGIAWTDPGVQPWPTCGFLEHATSPALTGLGAHWERRASVMHQHGDRFETVMWAPHVIRHEGRYHMFVATGGPDQTRWGITRATSPDLYTWTRAGAEPLFRDGFHARDPMVMWQPDERLWVLYYTATEHPERGRHVVAYRTSPDFVEWSERKIAYADRLVGTAAGPTESPFVIRRAGKYYLFLGPRPYEEPPPGVEYHLQAGYVGTDVFASLDWRRWTDADLVGHIRAHAAELVEDADGSWLISTCGVAQGGLYLAPFRWVA
jgi:arabinan endo-1,5-alpha-L-arabinosidase